MKKTLKYVDSIPKYMEGVSNIKNTTSTQYQWLYEHGCKAHRHRFTRHFSCFIKEFGIEEKKCFLDIETSNLKANFGVVLCWCIGDDEGYIYEDYMTREDIESGVEDKRVIKTCIETLKKFDRIIGHFSTYFDLPFLRTRALIHGLEFPSEGSILHTDVWKMAKRTLCLHSNRQDVISESLSGKTVKTRIDHPSWRRALLGNASAMAEVVDHCEKDIEDLKKNYYKLLPFYREYKTSI